MDQDPVNFIFTYINAFSLNFHANCTGSDTVESEQFFLLRKMQI